MDKKGCFVKAITIIDALKTRKTDFTLQDISGATGLNKTTAFRLCSMLVDYGILYKNEKTKTYRRGPKFLEWIFAYKDNLELYTEIKNILRIISETTKETVTVYKYKNDTFERVCIFRFEINENLRYTINIGDILPLNKGAGGKVILAFLKEDELNKYFNKLNLSMKEKYDILAQLEKIRKNGFHFSYGERDPYVSAFSIPLFDIDDGNIFGSLSTSGPTDRFRDRFKDEYIDFIKSKALHVQTLLKIEKEGGNRV